MCKVNLMYGVGDFLHTHININLFSEQEPDSQLIRGQIFNLDYKFDDGEIEEIVAKDVIDYIPIIEVDAVLKNWSNKLCMGGKLILSGTDLIEVCKAFSQYKLDINQTNTLLHGTQQKPYLIKRINFTAVGMSDYLSGVLGLKVIRKIVNNYTMTVEAIRIK